MINSASAAEPISSMSCPLSFGDPYGALNETGYHYFGGKDPTPLALLSFKINKTRIASQVDTDPNILRDRSGRCSGEEPGYGKVVPLYRAGPGLNLQTPCRDISKMRV